MQEQEKRFSVRFPPDVLETVKQLAKEDGRSINSEIIWLLKERIDQRRKQRPQKGV
jgi:hypothetical protein